MITSVRQSGILSPKLFNIYIDGLSNILNNSLIGSSICGNRINHMLYAVTYAWSAYPLQVCKNCYQSVMNIVLVILLHLMLNLYACFSNILLTNTDNSIVFLSRNHIDFFKWEVEK